jgi:hypothetical protein
VKPLKLLSWVLAVVLNIAALLLIAAFTLQQLRHPSGAQSSVTELVVFGVIVAAPISALMFLFIYGISYLISLRK